MALGVGDRGNIDPKPRRVTVSAMSPPLRQLLEAAFNAGVRAVDARGAVARALQAADPAPHPGRCAVVATGKASPGMAQALVDWLHASGSAPTSGVIVAAEPVPPPHRGLPTLAGDHPIPGGRSETAAWAIGETIAAFTPDTDVHVAISGGSSALIAGPLDQLPMRDLVTTFELLLTSGLDIDAMNAVRKRITRWSAGRLAAALAPRRVWTWLLSDVPGDDPATIGSGPCSPDRWTAGEVHDVLQWSGMLSRLPPAVVPLLDRETFKSGDAVFRNVSVRIVADNATARDAAAAEARRLGALVHVERSWLDGEAAEQGRRIAAMIRHAPRRAALEVWVLGGETTVTIAGDPGKGGRAQELALAAAAELSGTGDDVALVAAGTDGRDGPTDAAGACVTGHTWRRLVEAGVDGHHALTRHDSYPALDAVGALLRTGPTGTNVTDLVIAARRTRAE